MRKIIIRYGIILLLIITSVARVYGQAVEENEKVRTFLDNMFGTLDKSKVPHGLLRDFAFELVDMDRFDGSSLTETNSIDRQTYEMLLRTIRSSAVTIKPFEDVGNILVKQNSASSSPSTLTISALAYQYSVIKANALTDNLIQYNNGKVSDNYKNGTWQNPYDTRYVVGFCGQDSILTSSSVSFKLDPNCWFTNLSCKTIEIDTGSGYRSINIGSSITENYTTDGTKDIKLRITLTNGKQLLSHTKIQVIGNTLTRSLANDYYLTYPQAIITGEPYRGLKTKAEVYVAYAPSRVITRYALRKMEDAGMEHQVSLYISHDAPHLGANIPLGALYALYGLSSFLENKKTIGHFADKYADSGTLLTAIEKIAHSHAAKQLLVNYVDYGGELNNSEHYIWQNELATLGFPQGDNGREFRMLAIANGSYFVNTLPTSYLKVDFSASSDLIGLLPLVRWLTSPVLAWGLNDIWVGLLNLVPGKTTLKGLVEINPGISLGGKVTDIHLRYIKKCLWLVDVRHTIFSYAAHMNSNLLYDTYPNSYYDLAKAQQKIEGNQEDGIPIVGKYDYNVSMWNSIPFIPTSSALCVGHGQQNPTPNMFLQSPDIDNSPFGANIYKFAGLSSKHIDLPPLVLEWLNAQLDFGIIGPKQGFNGSRYIVNSKNIYNIEWSTNNPDIATIDQSGILTVTGNGIVRITAKGGNSLESSIEVMVGTPRFVLEDAIRKPGFYEIKSKCIDSQYAEFLNKYKNVLLYKWGIKTNDQPLVWFTSESPELHISTLENNDNTTVYLKIIDSEGNESAPLFVRISGQDIYDLTYKTLVFNKDGRLFNDKGIELFYDFVTMPLKYRDETYDEFSNAEWSPVAAIVINDENVPRGIPWKRKGYIRDIIPPSEKERILSSPDGKVMIYKLQLLNFDGEIVQQTPFTIMYKSNYPNN